MFTYNRSNNLSHLKILNKDVKLQGQKHATYKVFYTSLWRAYVKVI